MTEALRRRCLHAFLDYPPPSREIAILKIAVPGIEDTLAARMVAFVDALRTLDLRKAPAISETIDWARGVLLLGGNKLDKELVRSTLGVLLKHQADKEVVEGKVEKMLGDVEKAAGA
jgi:MoxR-like ATPase